MDAKSEFRRLMLAAAGAAGMAYDEAGKVLDKLVARGEIAEKDAKAVLKKITGSKPVDMAKRAATGAVKAADLGLEAVLDRMRVPTKADLAALQKKIDSLNRKIDKLTGSK